LLQLFSVPTLPGNSLIYFIPLLHYFATILQTLFIKIYGSITKNDRNVTKNDGSFTKNNSNIPKNDSNVTISSRKCCYLPAFPLLLIFPLLCPINKSRSSKPFPILSSSHPFSPPQRKIIVIFDPYD